MVLTREIKAVFGLFVLVVFLQLVSAVLNSWIWHYAEEPAAILRMGSVLHGALMFAAVNGLMLTFLFVMATLGRIYRPVPGN